MVDTTVITEKQARQITGGRKPLVPVEYEQACKALAECVDIDEAKYWSDKSDALAAWAKIYHDDEVSLSARRLKLKAYHRLGALARELRPGGFTTKGSLPGPRTLLIEKGLRKAAADQALSISRASDSEIKKHVEAGNGVVRTARAFLGQGVRPGGKAPSSDGWHWLTHQNESGPRLAAARTAIRRRSAREAAAAIAPREVSSARAMVQELIEWLDEFEQYLPKSETV